MCLFLSCAQLFVTPWTVAHQAPLSMGFSRQEYWSGLHGLLQGIFPTQGLNPGLLHCRWILYQLSYQGSSEKPKGKRFPDISFRQNCWGLPWQFQQLRLCASIAGGTSSILVWGKKILLATQHSGEKEKKCYISEMVYTA